MALLVLLSGPSDMQSPRRPRMMLDWGCLVVNGLVF